jgi:hypothetical protein
MQRSRGETQVALISPYYSRATLMHHPLTPAAPLICSAPRRQAELTNCLFVIFGCVLGRSGRLLGGGLSLSCSDLLTMMSIQVHCLHGVPIGRSVRFRRHVVQGVEKRWSDWLEL